jgi:hypothetical protein
MNHRYNWKTIFCVGVLFLLAAAVWRFVQPASSPVVLAQNPPAEIECVAYCSDIRPGVSYIEVRWRLAAQPMTDADRRAQLARQKLDVTVYADGFEQGMFAQVEGMRPRTAFRSMTSAGTSAGSDRRARPLPGLSRLRLVDVGTRETRPAETLRLLDSSITAAGPEWVVARLEGVEPGMEYTFRVPGGQATTTCEAVVCPVDSQRRPAGKPRAVQPKPGF